MKDYKVTNEILAHDFFLLNHGKMDDQKLEENIAVLTSPKNEAPYSANGSVASMLFYLKFQVNIDDGKTFEGNAGGISTPGGGALLGDVYTDDLERLYRETVSFEFNCTSVYTSLLFFNSNGTLLGHFQSFSVSTVNGVGGGRGKWL